MFDTKFDRYDFSAIIKRPVYEWPNGKRLAVYFAINIEAFEFGRSPGPDFTTLPSAPFHRSYAYRDFGNRVGVWRMADLFSDAQIPLSVLLNTAVYDVCPETLVPFRERGDEFVGHGRTNSEKQIDMTEEQERAMLDEVNASFMKHEKRMPKGWLGPFISQSANTPDLLKKSGYTYMMDWYFDEQPQWFRTKHGPILAVPYPSMEMNDGPAILNRGASDAEFAKMLVDAFDEQLRDSQKYPLVYAVSLHTYMMGQPHRAKLLREVLGHLAKHRGDVWFATAGQIADHIYSLPDGVVAKPLPKAASAAKVT